MVEPTKKGKLILEDNSVFSGISFGSPYPVSGEVVFNTGMVGYPESFTDPSYKGQILTLTYPLIGNYGMPSSEKDSFGIEKFYESSKAQISGLIVSDYSFEYSHWNAKKSLQAWLVEQKIPALYGIDTRALTKKLREKGVMLGRIIIEDKDVELEDPNKRNLVSEVSINEPVLYSSSDTNNPSDKTNKTTIVLVDCGAKNNIIRSLLARNVSVYRVPWNFDLFSKSNSPNFDGIVLSNGPGDPKSCKQTIETIKKAIESKIPIFGICLGNQILALASGADTYKLKYGHRGQNQPAVLADSKRCFITSQNHGYAVDEKSLGKDWKPWFRNLNDGTNEGIIHKSGVFKSVQFHPEATPGPNDTAFLFDEFIKLVKNQKVGK